MISSFQSRILFTAMGALVLAACGKVETRQTVKPDDPPPNPPPTTITGRVIKGYVQGAAVFIDINGNNQPDNGEPLVQTDSEGRYTLPAGQSGVVVAIGGIDTTTNVPLDGNVFRAPAGSSVITPFTTLVTELIEGGSSTTQAEAQIRDAFGLTLPAGSTLLDFNSVGSTAGAAVEDKAEAVMNTISAIRSILGGAGVTLAAEEAIAAVAELARESSGPVNLGDATVVSEALSTAVVTAGLSLPRTEDALRIAQAITSVNAQLLSNSGTSEDAVAATRYAQSQLQDLMTQIGETADDSDGSSIDLSQLDEQASGTIDQIIESPDDVIAQGAATTIALEERIEDRTFAFALRPAVVLVNGQAAAVQSVAVQFGIAGLQVKKLPPGPGSTPETVAPDGEGIYRLGYAELDKVQLVPPADFNGRIAVTVTITYAGVGARPAETLHIDVGAANDAPVTVAGFGASLARGRSATVQALFAAGFDDSLDDRRGSSGSQANTLAGVAVAGNASSATQGVWQYSRDSGQSWSNIPTVSDSGALLLAATDRLRFQPAASAPAGVPGALSAYLIDSSAGVVTGGTMADVSATARGATSPYSSSAVSLTAGAIVSVGVAAPGVQSTINATQLAGGVEFTVSLAGVDASAGDRIELRVNGEPLQPPLTKVLTAQDIAAGEITIVVPSAGFGVDGPKSVDATFTYVDSGVRLVSSPLSLSLDTRAPAVPDVALAGLDTGESASDRITSSRTALLDVALSADAATGDVVHVATPTESIVQATVSATDIAARVLRVRIDDLADGVHRFTARVADAAGNLSAASLAADVAIDTQAPAPVALDLGSSLPSIHGVDARTFAVAGSGAEVGTIVEIRLSRPSIEPAIYLATPDSNGRFAAQVDAAAVGPGQVSIAARDIDVAGNASATVTSQITVNETANENVIAGVANADELVGGTVGADTFVAGAQSGQDYFIGGSGFDALRVSGPQADYTISFVPDAQRAAHQVILQGAAILLQGGLPLVRLARSTNAGGETFFFQAEAVEFTDGTVRIVPQAAVAAGAGNLAGAAGDDRLFAGNGGARLSGGAGNDILVGGTGADRLRNSICSTTTQGSTLVGGGGADVLQIVGDSSCERGLVKAYGGAGQDRFEIAAAAGFDMDVVLEDVRPGEDRIDLTTLRIVQSGTARPLVPADLGLAALSQALAAEGRAEIHLSRFVAADGAPLNGVLRIELSPYAVPALRETDFLLAGS